jgi:integrase
MAWASCFAASVRKAATLVLPGARIVALCLVLDGADPLHMVPFGTRFHDRRHFYASALIAANLNPKVIQARLGHATVAETMDTDGHLFQDAEDLASHAVDDALADALAEQRRNKTVGEAPDA